jgi:hypothetical protein
MKRLLRLALWIPSILIIANAFSNTAEAQRRVGRQNEDRVCFYMDDQFRGDSFCANAGESVRNVGGRFNDRISSIRISGRLEVTVFENDNFDGSRRTFNRDVTNLQDIGWNDMITSFQVSGDNRGGDNRGEDNRGWDNRGGDNRNGDNRGDDRGYDRRNPEPRNGACFYVDSDFRGERFCLNAGEEERNVGRRFNDRISSMRIFGRARVMIFSDDNFRGPGREFNRDVRNLLGLNDRITSIRVR